MGRNNVYFRDKVAREVNELVQIELQNGATRAEVNFSSMVNELVSLGLMVKKHQGEKSKFDIDGFNRDLIRKVSGTREGTTIMMAMLSEIYLQLRGENSADKLTDILNQNITAMMTAEDDAESKHFIQEEDK